MIDLHVHSTASDGTYSPTDLARYAGQKGLTAIALTDHDTVSGIAECQKTGEEIGLKVIAGIEFSAEHWNREVHILGYHIDYQDKAFLRRLAELVQLREARNIQILDKLTQGGFPLTPSDLYDDASQSAVITRANIARAMLKKGYIQSMNEAFKYFIGEGKPYYVPRQRLTAKETIELIHRVNGLAVLAHPMLYGYDQADVTQLIYSLKEIGLDGVECFYSTHQREDTLHLCQVCSNFHLFPTGGSDFHGENKPNLDLGVGYGDLNVPDTLLEAFIKH